MRLIGNGYKDSRILMEMGNIIPHDSFHEDQVCILVNRAIKANTPDKVRDILSSLEPEKRQKILQSRYLDRPLSIHCAAEATDWDMMNAVLEGFNVDIRFKLLTMRNHQQKTPLHLAVGRHNHQTVQIILSSITPDKRMQLLLTKDSEGCTALHMAAIKSSDEQYRITASKVARALICSENFMHLDHITKLNADRCYKLLAAETSFSQTPLHVACRTGNREVAFCILRVMRETLSCNKSLELLRRLDSEPNSAASPVHLAALNGFVEILKLMEGTVNSSQWYDLLQEKNKRRATPLHLAALGGHSAVVEAIGNSVNCEQFLHLLSETDEYGSTPLDLALEENQMEVVNIINKILDSSAWYRILIHHESKHADRLAYLKGLGVGEGILLLAVSGHSQLLHCIVQAEIQLAEKETNNYVRQVIIEGIQRRPMSHEQVRHLSSISNQYIIPFSREGTQKYALIMYTRDACDHDLESSYDEDVKQLLANCGFNTRICRLESSDKDLLVMSIKRIIHAIPCDSSMVFVICKLCPNRVGSKEHEAASQERAILELLTNHLVSSLETNLPLVMVAQVSGKSHATLYRPDTLLVSVEDNLGEASKQLAMSMLTHADGERDVYELVMTALALYDASRHRCLKSDQRPVLQSTLTKRLVLPSFTSEIGRGASFYEAKTNIKDETEQRRFYSIPLQNIHALIHVDKDKGSRCDDVEHALGQLIQDRVIRADMNGNIAPFSDLLIKDPNECSLLIAFVVNDQHDLAGEFNRSSNADHILKKISTVLPDSTPLILIVQTCNERKPNRTALSVDVESLPSDKIFASETERQIFRPNTVLLLATVNDTETEEASFVHYVANQFRKTDGDKDVFSIFTSIASHMTDENDFSQVHVLCESTLDKYLVLPSLLTASSHSIQFSDRGCSRTGLAVIKCRDEKTSKQEPDRPEQQNIGSFKDSASKITASDELSRNMVDLSNILQALSQVDLGLAIIQNEPNQLVQIKIRQDRVFNVLRTFGIDSLEDIKSTAVSCILLTCMVKEGPHEQVFHLLLLVRGNITATNHYFNVGKDHSWQITRVKIMNIELERLIMQLHCEQFHTPQMIILSLPPNTSDSTPQLVSPTKCQGKLSFICPNNPMSFNLQEAGEGYTSNFQIRLNEKVVDEVTGCFSDYESSSEGSDNHHIVELIDHLDVHEDERCVTVIAMAAADGEGIPHYLLHLIAGRLKQPILKQTDKYWSEIQTHHVGNDALYDEITTKSLSGLNSLENAEKRRRILNNSPAFVVSSSFPSSTYDGNFIISNVMSPVVKVDEDGRESYVYQNTIMPELRITLHEPRSPMLGEYATAQAVGSAEIDLLKKNPMEDLDRAQCEMFHDIHNGEDNSASLDDAVSAITSVSRLANGQLKRCVYLLAGAWYGHGIARYDDDLPGWKVTAVPIFNSKLRVLINNNFNPSAGTQWCMARNGLTANLGLEDLCQDYDSIVRLKLLRDGMPKALITSKLAPTVNVEFHKATESQLTPDQLKMLAEPVPEHLVDVRRYETNSAAEKRDNDLNRVMISVHCVKTKLAQVKKRKRGVKGMTKSIKILEGRPESTTVVVLAVGNEQKLGHPLSFSYREPFNSWHSKTVFVNSHEIKMNIESTWEKLYANSLVGLERKQSEEHEPNALKSIAKHQILDAYLDIKPMVLARGNLLKPEKPDQLLEFTSHNRDPNALLNFLEHNQDFLVKCRQWHENEKCCNIFEEIKSFFYNESNVPVSYKFPTSRVRHRALSRPDQLGNLGKLVLLYQDEAHIKFTQLSTIKEVSEPDIVGYLESFGEKLKCA